MRKIQIIFTGIFLGGVLLGGIGTGIAMVEYSSLSYGGEYIIGEDDLITKNMDFDFPMDGRILTVGNSNYMGLGNVAGIEMDEAVPVGTVRYEVTYNEKTVTPYLNFEEIREPSKEPKERISAKEHSEDLAERENVEISIDSAGSEGSESFKNLQEEESEDLVNLSEGEESEDLVDLPEGEESEILVNLSEGEESEDLVDLPEGESEISVDLPEGEESEVFMNLPEEEGSEEFKNLPEEKESQIFVDLAGTEETMPQESDSFGVLYLLARYQNREFSLLMENKDRVLKDLKEKKVSHYEIAYITDVKIKVNPQTLPYIKSSYIIR